MIHVDFDPHRSTKNPEVVSVKTLDEAMAAIKQRYPVAVKSVRWTLPGHNFSWNYTMCNVWKDKHDMELDSDVCSERTIALLVNESEDAPGPDEEVWICDDVRWNGRDCANCD